MTQSESASNDLIRRAANGEESALAELFSAYRERLRRMVQIRLDRRLQGRIDPSDVLQEAFLDLASELPKFVRQDNPPVFLWLRWVTGQRLMRIHREHLGVQARDASREISLFSGPMPMASSVSLAAQLAGRVSSASQAVMRAEVQLQIQQALNAMEDLDREIIALRNFEELTNREAADVLGLSESAASKRYVRALVKLQSALRAIPGLKEWTD
jgi:RNA polymerase sigma-70 factor (ECF subfamily)